MTPENEYVPLKTRAYLAAGIIGAQGLLAAGMILCIIAYFMTPNAVLRGQPLTLVLHDLMSGLRGMLYWVGAVLFLVWLYRAHKNLTALRSEHLEFTPG